MGLGSVRKPQIDSGGVLHRLPIQADSQALICLHIFIDLHIGSIPDVILATNCRKQLFDNGVGLMRAAYEKLSKYYYEPEGAFHYNWYDGASTSQGVPVSLGLHEGDVNATSMAIDTIFRIFDLLELEVGKPFDREDGKKFLEKIGE